MPRAPFVTTPKQRSQRDRCFDRTEHRRLIISQIFLQSSCATTPNVPKSAHSAMDPHAPCFLPSTVFNSVLISSSIPSLGASDPRWSGSAASFSETVLGISIVQESESFVCPNCQLKQYEPGGSLKCRRCHHHLGISYLEIYLPSSVASLTSQSETAIRKEGGGLIRRLRSRREITQAGLASLTGIHRTYLSRAECGRVLPSIIALIKIARALDVDKILLRVRSRRN
jgi:DNA-binding XRE family transcriptional regulator